jgi:hypothetical protein
MHTTLVRGSERLKAADEGAGDEWERSIFARPGRQVAGPDAGFTDIFDPDELPESETCAMRTRGVSTCVRLARDLLFPAR